LFAGKYNNSESTIHGYWIRTDGGVKGSSTAVIANSSIKGIPAHFDFNIIKNTITYALPKEVPVELSIYSLKGQMVYKMSERTKSAGYYSMTTDKLIPGNFYVCKISAGEYKSIKKLACVK